MTDSDPMNSKPENSMQKLEQHFSVKYEFPVYFVRGAFNADHELLASILSEGGKKPHKVFCILDSGVHAHHPHLYGQIEDYAAGHREAMHLCGPPQIIPGGEKCKSQTGIVESIIADIGRYHLCRQSFVLAIGGGAVLDVAGYAAAIAHRGLRLIRMPTSVLAQNDAGVGVKNGINALGRKNFLGTFAPPFAVINDFSFLDTLPERELRAGMAEAVKVALIRDRPFFEYMHNQRSRLASFDRKIIEEMIYRCAAIHMQHIGTSGDPFEFGSARPLDFGHWSAHKLEEMTGGRLNHGEAVSVGMALDSLYSLHTGMLQKNDLRQVLTLLSDLGLPLFHPALKAMDIPSALDEFREHLGGELAITLLTGIGSRQEVSRIDTVLMARCIDELAVQTTLNSSNPGRVEATSAELN